MDFVKAPVSYDEIYQIGADVTDVKARYTVSRYICKRRHLEFIADVKQAPADTGSRPLLAEVSINLLPAKVQRRQYSVVIAACDLRAAASRSWTFFRFRPDYH